jgi:hypothetical protein
MARSASQQLLREGREAEPAAEAFDADPLRRRETVELVSAYYRIDDPALRRRLFELARALAVEPNGQRRNRSSRHCQVEAF